MQGATQKGCKGTGESTESCSTTLIVVVVLSSLCVAMNAVFVAPRLLLLPWSAVLCGFGVLGTFQLTLSSYKVH